MTLGNRNYIKFKQRDIKETIEQIYKLFIINFRVKQQFLDKKETMKITFFVGFSLNL